MDSLWYFHTTYVQSIVPEPSIVCYIRESVSLCPTFFFQLKSQWRHWEGPLLGEQVWLLAVGPCCLGRRGKRALGSLAALAPPKCPGFWRMLIQGPNCALPSHPCTESKGGVPMIWLLLALAPTPTALPLHLKMFYFNPNPNRL